MRISSVFFSGWKSVRFERDFSVRLRREGEVLFLLCVSENLPFAFSAPNSESCIFCHCWHQCVCVCVCVCVGSGSGNTLSQWRHLERLSGYCRWNKPHVRLTKSLLFSFFFFLWLETVHRCSAKVRHRRLCCLQQQAPAFSSSYRLLWWPTSSAQHTAWRPEYRCLSWRDAGSLFFCPQATPERHLRLIL